MTPQEHLAKAERLVGSLDHLRTPCHEMEIEARMLAATHLVNALLHARKLREQDIVHAWGSSREAEGEAAAALRLLEIIEELRPLYVRGEEPDSGRAVETAASAYQQLAAMVVAAVRGG